MDEFVSPDQANSPDLARLSGEVARDLARIAHPRQPWLEPILGPDGAPALDVLVCGGGQSGLAIAFGLKRAQVTNILVLDKAPAGRDRFVEARRFTRERTWNKSCQERW